MTPKETAYPDSRTPVLPSGDLQGNVVVEVLLFQQEWTPRKTSIRPSTQRNSTPVPDLTDYTVKVSIDPPHHHNLLPTPLIDTGHQPVSDTLLERTVRYTLSLVQSHRGRTYVCPVSKRLTTSDLTLPTKIRFLWSRTFGTPLV